MYDVMNGHLGFFVYDNQAFTMREDALDLMLLKKDYGGTIQFYYNDHVFTNLVWEKDIPVSISRLYKMRAQQLRDKYKYLVLRFSGGSDSIQVLESFLKNGIFLDEIIIGMQEKAINNLDRSMMVNDHELSQFLEYERAVIPYLKKVKELSPNTKITPIDTSDGLYDQLANKKFEYIGNNDDPINIRFVTPQLSKSYTFLVQKYEQKLEGDGIAVIRGLEKPVLKIEDDGKIIFTFFDITLSGALTIQRGNPNYTIEDFFWTPDFPLIPVKQSHMIIQRLSTDKELYLKYKALLAEILRARDDPTYKNGPGYMLERLYNHIIYPDWSPLVFAAPKSMKINPDFKLLDTLGIKHDADKFTSEYSSYKMKKYEKIVNKTQLNKLMFSRPYYLGQFEPTFKI